MTEFEKKLEEALKKVKGQSKDNEIKEANAQSLKTKSGSGK